MTQDKGRKMLRNVKNYCGLISATLLIDKFRMLLRKSLLVLITNFSHANALVFERRPRPAPELSYFLYPVAGSIPGLQDFHGLGATVSGIGGSEVDITAVSLRGEAKYFEEGDFGIEFLTVLDIPVFSPRLTLSLFYTDIRNGTWPESERGINSDPDKTYYLL